MQTELKNTLTKEQLEYITEYLLMFKHAYFHITHKKLETADELINLVMSDEITFEDVFMAHTDIQFDINGDSQDEEFWERNMEAFMYENYYPDEHKKVNEGAWIKIRNKNGFEVHYAKKAGRKRRYSEEYAELMRKYQRLMEKTIDNLSSVISIENELTSDELKTRTKSDNKKIDSVFSRIKELSVRMVIDLPVYEVKINRTKHVTEYYMPYQYELVHDIEEFSDAYVQNIPGVTIKSLYTSQNADAVFYLQSRGISKKVAEMMAALKQTYFSVDMSVAMKAYHDVLNNCEFK